MSRVSVRCHQCGQPFSDWDPTVSGGILLEGAVCECPHCGTKDPYFTADVLAPTPHETSHRAVADGFAARSHRSIRPPFVARARAGVGAD